MPQTGDQSMRTRRSGDLASNASAAAIEHLPPRLSPREGEIVDLLIMGKTYKEVAAALHISARTVEHYVERLKSRFHQPRLPALACYLAAHGLTFERH